MSLLTIYKYQLLLSPAQLVKLPAGAKVLHVGEQYGTLCLWALVDPGAPLEDHGFMLYSTGETIDREDALGDYRATVIMPGGSLVWHVFEQPEASS